MVEAKHGLHQSLLKALQIDRVEVFGPTDNQLPVSEPEDAAVPQIGFVGRDYRPGGDVLFGINPGGGGDSYKRTPEDLRLLPMIAALRNQEASLDAINTVFDQYAENMRTWNLWRIVEPVLCACRRSQSEIAYLNWCPFRTRKDAMPHIRPMLRCRELYLAPLIANLAPGRIIALGKKVGGLLERKPFGDIPGFVVPRTNGDTYLSTAARKALEEIRARSPYRQLQRDPR